MRVYAMETVSAAFLKELSPPETFNANACINCGVCTAICPMGLHTLPRELFRYVLLGLRAKVVENQETIFSCLLCKLCEANCPADVHIAENVRILRGYINRNIFKL
jgi:heterodisulfide reductase subunit C